MQLDRTTLDRLLALDDVTLAKTIKALASTAGIDERAIQGALQNLRLVRASLSNATDADLKKAAEMLGPNRANAIKQQLEDMDNGEQ